MIDALQRNVPDIMIDVAVTRPSVRELFAGAMGVNRVIYLPYWEKGKIDFAKALLSSFTLQPYDVSFLGYAAARSEYSIIQQAFRAKQKFAHDYERTPLREFVTSGIRMVSIGAGLTSSRNFDLLKEAGFATPAVPRYVLPPAWRSEEITQANLLCVHAGSIDHDGLQNRRWPPEHFAEIASRYIERGFDVGIITGPNDVQATTEVLRVEPRARIIEGPLEFVARTLSRSRIVLSNDSGIAHLAGALGRQVLVLFGPTPVEHSATGNNVVRFRPSDCPPCFDLLHLDLGCVRSIDYACIRRDLTVQSVDDQLKGLLQLSSTLPA